MDREALDRELAVLRRNLIDAAVQLMTHSGNRPFSAMLIDGQPLMVAVGPRSSFGRLAADVVVDVESNQDGKTQP